VQQKLKTSEKSSTYRTKQTQILLVRFMVLTATSMMLRRDDGGISSPETSVNIYKTTRRNIPEDNHFQNE
jgi:hypothetical protein